MKSIRLLFTIFAAALVFAVPVKAGNTAVRPTVSGTLNVVNFVDNAGSLGSTGVVYSALVVNDYSANSGNNGNTTSGMIDVILVDPVKLVRPGDFTAGHNGHKTLYETNVIDQGNLPSSVTATGTTTTASGTITVPTAVAAGVPASGYATGAGIIPGATFTLSGTVVTLSGSATASSTTASVTFSASPYTVSYWRFPVSFTQ